MYMLPGGFMCVGEECGYGMDILGSLFFNIYYPDTMSFFGAIRLRLSSRKQIHTDTTIIPQTQNRQYAPPLQVLLRGGTASKDVSYIK